MENHGIMPKDYVRIGPAVDIALNSAILLLNKSVTFDVDAYEVGSTCHANTIGTIGAQIYYKTPNLHLFLGPGCSVSMVMMGRMAADWNIAVMSGATTDNIFSNTKIFRTLARVVFNRVDAVLLIKALMVYYQWNILDLIYDSCWQDVFHTVLVRYFKNESKVDVQEYGFCGNNNSENNHFILKKLKGLRTLSKVVIISAKTPIVRQAMIIAHQLKMTEGDYVFLGQQTITAVDDPRINWQRHDEYDEIARKAFESLLFVQLWEPETEEYRNFTAEVKRRSKENYNYTFAEDEEVTSFAADYHDCVYLYALALNECISENCDPTDGAAMARRMWNRTFKGIGGDVTLSEIGEKHSNYYVKDFNPKTGKMEDVFIFIGDTAEFRKLGEIHWPNNRGPPKNEPECGYIEENTCPISKANDPIFMATIGAMLGLIVILLPSGIAFYRKRKLESQLSDMWWKVESKDILPIVNEKAARNSTWGNFGISHTKMNSDDTSENEKKLHIMDNTVATYQDKTVKLIYWNIPAIKITRDLLMDINQIRNITHENLSRLLGLCLDDNNICTIIEYCTKGTLQEVLTSGVMELDWSFKFSLLNDMIEGMAYLHHSSLSSHGYFTSSMCMINSRFMLIVSGFGLPTLRKAVIEKLDVDHDLLWRAPELLDVMPINGTQKGDVYSFSIIIQEIITQTKPFDTEMELMGLEGILVELKVQDNPTPFRPKIPKDLCPANLQELMESCWLENPAKRPSFSDIKKAFAKINTNTGGIVDNLINRLESYAKNLENIVADRTSALLEEKQKVENLLYQLMPRFVADQLKMGIPVDPEHFDDVSLFFSDICGFTSLSAASTPMQVVALLNDLYTCFDSIIDKYDVYKVETIGDAYIIVSGLPVRNGNMHAKHIANMSLDLLYAIKIFKIRHRPDDHLRVRIGLHRGPCTSGIVGVKMPRYCLFGKTCNFANSMESGGEPMRIHISQPLKTLLDEFGCFQIIERGIVTILKMEVTTYWLLNNSEDPRDV